VQERPPALSVSSLALAAEQPNLVEALFLLSYPLHPPKKPEQLRTAHFPDLRTPAFFVHGSADPFGSIAEIEQALTLIPARTQLLPVEGVGHDLGQGRFDPSAMLGALIN